MILTSFLVFVEGARSSAFCYDCASCGASWAKSMHSGREAWAMGPEAGVGKGDELELEDELCCCMSDPMLNFSIFRNLKGGSMTLGIT